VLTVWLSVQGAPYCGVKTGAEAKVTLLSARWVGATLTSAKRLPK